MHNFESKTEENLQAAFAGESMANRKYLYFAKVARKLGNEDIAKLFEETAHQETGHAFAHLELLYPSSEMTVEKLLEIAIEGELYETNQMYPEFERVAVAEGKSAAVDEFREQALESKEHAEIFTQAAKRFKALTMVEKYHAGRYQKALEQVKTRTEESLKESA
ncbi:MAG: rubrerythrin family protein [Candidatus Obscuribacterales bacterium]|nr:rubrerythrin family protein [Candidatus Obscuribacterales bacterium]